ncbi:hypothetical protein ACMGDK_11215 [Chryseobacterium sp. DT-3]|uniref:hypothetical protein n=1 Tax=Chryseobacterium sp. DT-3 TaxID=3396164 RepID=UPI003F1B7B02
MKTNFSIKISDPTEYINSMNELVKLGYKEDKERNQNRIKKWKDGDSYYLECLGDSREISLFSFYPSADTIVFGSLELFLKES